MELFEKVVSAAHYNYQDSNGGCWAPTNGELLGETIISDLVIFHLRKKIIRLEKLFKLPEINSL